MVVSHKRDSRESQFRVTRKEKRNHHTLVNMASFLSTFIPWGYTVMSLFVFLTQSSYYISSLKTYKVNITKNISHIKSIKSILHKILHLNSVEEWETWSSKQFCKIILAYCSDNENSLDSQLSSIQKLKRYKSGPGSS